MQKIKINKEYILDHHCIIKFNKNRNTVNNIRDIRKWLPIIKKELIYNVSQLEANRNYTDFKIKEFKEKTELVLF